MTQALADGRIHTNGRMSARGKFLWGGLGALAPIVATFLILDVETIGGYLSDTLGNGAGQFLLAGYGLRVVGLFIVGGVWASLHRLEGDPRKLFQLGIVAPAMITGMLNASNVYDNRTPGSERLSAVSLSLIAPAHAGESQDKDKDGDDKSALDQLIQGFLGKSGK